MITDRVWGTCLIAIGVLMVTVHPFDGLNDTLAGMPDATLSVLLVGLAIIALLIAIHGTPAQKALAIFWIVTP